MKNKYYDQLKNKLPEELEELKRITEQVLNEITNVRETNLNYQVKNKDILCPKCESTNIVKNGFKNGTQRYKCKKCTTFFSISTNTITSGLRLSYKQLCDYFQCLIDFNTIEKTAQIVGISQTEAYNLRVKILSTLSLFDSTKLHGEVQCDEKYVRINLKGTKRWKMPRESHKNGIDNRISGISDEQVCILMAIDSFDNIFVKIIGLGPPTTKEIEDNFSNYIEKGSVLITDSKAAYIKFAQDNGLKLIQIPSKKHTTKDGKHLGELNQLMSDLDILILRCKGISTRHLQEYLDLFKFRKILNYTVEYLKQNKELYNYVLIQKELLTTRKVHKKKMPVNISKHYGVAFD